MTEMTPIYKRPKLIENEEAPFQGDLFSRNHLVDKLNNLIARLPNGGVIAIDAPWGEGKSWFGKNWQLSLKNDGYKTAFIDAFQEDFIEDPFLMIVSHMVEAVKDDEDGLKQQLITAGSKLAINLAPAAAKAGLKVFGRWALKTDNISEDVKTFLEDLNENVADSIQEKTKELISAHRDYIKDVNEFKTLITKSIEDDDKPLVVFIDELDRCRPDFSVKTLERIKHLFDIDGLVFVLLVNKDQLSESIKGFYGAGIKADVYLRKFIQFSLMLPKSTGTSRQPLGDNDKFCRYLLEQKYAIPYNDQLAAFNRLFVIFSNYFGLSLRDVENGVALFLLSNVVGNSKILISWPIALKIAKPDLYSGIVRADKDSHREAYSLLNKIKADGNERELIIDVLADLHASFANQDFEMKADKESNALRSLYPTVFDKSSVLGILFNSIDMNIST